MEDQHIENNLPNKKNFLVGFIEKRPKTFVVLVFFVLLLFLYFFLQRPNKEFPVGQVFTIYPGESLQEITNTLYKEGVIKSPLVFRNTVILLSGERRVMAGDYMLNEREGSFSLANRFVNGDFRIDVVKITIPEGWNVFQIADYLESKLINFDKVAFINLARKEEGYLFPDTYFISPAIKTERLIELFKNNFENRIKKIEEIEDSPYSLPEIITMASILEGEARTTESRRTIAGILWKRLSLGMPLQVDASFSYVNGKNTYELTLDDLQIDSPYNTYKYRGLPPTPIANPGLDSIRSALNPINTKYLYFLSSTSGQMYYAQTFEEHKKNKELYLK